MGGTQRLFATMTGPRASQSRSLDFIRNKDFRANSPGFLGQIPYF